MQIVINQIGPEGLEKTCRLDEQWLATVLAGAGTVDFRPVAPCDVQVRAERSGVGVRLQADFRLPLLADCAACLEDFRLEVPVRFDIQMKPRPAGLPPPPVEQELKAEDLDEYFYEGDSIDVGQVLHEQVVLALPLYPRCSPDCLGLCPQCGANRNREPCSCREQAVDPRWAALRNLTGK